MVKLLLKNAIAESVSVTEGIPFLSKTFKYNTYYKC